MNQAASQDGLNDAAVHGIKQDIKGAIANYMKLHGTPWSFLESQVDANLRERFQGGTREVQMKNVMTLVPTSTLLKTPIQMPAPTPMPTPMLTPSSTPKLTSKPMLTPISPSVANGIDDPSARDEEKETKMPTSKSMPLLMPTPKVYDEFDSEEESQAGEKDRDFIIAESNRRKNYNDRLKRKIAIMTVVAAAAVVVAVMVGIPMV